MNREKVSIPHIAWRNNRPRFSPGPKLRALGIKGEDLRHGPKGPWFTEAEAREWIMIKHAEIAGVRESVHPLRHKRASGFVYFLRCGDTVKIGFSINPFRRASEMLTAIGTAISTLVAVRGTRADETALHAQFATLRRAGEWFDMRPDLEAVMLESAAWGRVQHRARPAENKRGSHVRPVRPPSAA